jgi:DNA-directed RNA polymerase subunit RPC12/RpoP
LAEEELVGQYLRNRDLPCPACGHNLRGTTMSFCPRCGKEFTLPTLQMASAPTDPELERARLTEFLADRDVPCPTCGINLRAHDQLECPACGRELSLWILRPRGLEGAGRGGTPLHIRLFMAFVCTVAAGGLLWIILVLFRLAGWLP